MQSIHNFFYIKTYDDTEKLRVNRALNTASIIAGPIIGIVGLVKNFAFLALHASTHLSFKNVSQKTSDDVREDGKNIFINLIRCIPIVGGAALTSYNIYQHNKKQK